MDRDEIQEKIKRTAKGTDVLITRLDTLTSRIDTAKANQNQELAEYYERQFSEASVEFMSNVESILDGWYSLKGEKRPALETERLLPEDLDEIHRAVVSIVQGLSVPPGDLSCQDSTINSPQAKKEPEHRVDVTG